MQGVPVSVVALVLACLLLIGYAAEERSPDRTRTGPSHDHHGSTRVR